MRNITINDSTKNKNQDLLERIASAVMRANVLFCGIFAVDTVIEVIRDLTQEDK